MWLFLFYSPSHSSTWCLSFADACTTLPGSTLSALAVQCTVWITSLVVAPLPHRVLGAHASLQTVRRRGATSPLIPITLPVRNQKQVAQRMAVAHLGAEAAQNGLGVDCKCPGRNSD
mmetsp:Transcript_42110/g.75395  ORF Transcript_42110/g.75395 Transcript_42110/m.75395 type:complete len:117 (+) Transcript_42110:1723-2073(+)